MDLSTLEKQIKGLEARSDSLESWLSVWITVVVIGLVIEVAAVVLEHWRQDHNKTGRTLIVALVGPVLITLGVAGELGIHFKSGRVNGDLQNANREMVALINQSATTAYVRATRAEAQIADANRKASEANARAKSFEAQIASASAKAAEARSIAEREGRARAQLEASIVGRELSPMQQRDIGNSLRTFAGRPVGVNSYVADAEGFRIGQMTMAALEFGQLSVRSAMGRTMPVGMPTVGVSVTGPSPEQDLVRAIHAVLGRNGLEMAPLGLQPPRLKQT